MKKLNLNIKTEAEYVRVVSSLLSKNLTKSEMKIIILLLQLLNQEKTDVITQEHKERVRLSLNLSSQTMHNYWSSLKKRKVVIGNYKDYKFNKIFQNNTQLVITYNVK